MQSFLKYWLPVLAWMLVIFAASTDLMSAQHTSRFIGPFLLWLNPALTAEQIATVQFAVRKAAHVTEYAILATLTLRALYRGVGALHFGHALSAFMIASGYAAFDEYHQSLVASRTGSLTDVAIDASGALVGVMICWCIIASGNRSRPA